jgi:ABC-2 type transport system permease protein
MLNDRRVFDVARFEFRKFLDIKGEIVALGLLLVIALVRFGGEAVVQWSSQADAYTVLVEATSAPRVEAAKRSGRFEYKWASPNDRQVSLSLLLAGQADAIVVPINDEWSSIDVLVRSRQPWLSELEDSLSMSGSRSLLRK